MVHVLGRTFDAIMFWASLLTACCAIILAILVHILYSLRPATRRARMNATSREMMRRDMDRVAEYLDGLARSEPAVREPFERGLAAMEAFNWEQAVELFWEAMLRARGAELVALLNLTGVCRYTQGRLNDARANFEQALRMAEQFRDETGKAPALGNIGVVWHDLGELERALFYKERALDKAHRLGDQWAEAIYLANIGNIWHDKGDLDKALEYHERAFRLSRDLGDKWGVASDLSSIASVFRDKGAFGRALKYDQQALLLARKIGHRLGVVSNLSSIANIYRYQGKMNQALKYGEEALEMARRIGYQLGVATDLGNIGLILVRKRKCEQAAPKLAEALSILLAGDVAKGPQQLVAGLARCENRLGRERLESLLRESGLEERDIAEQLDLIDQARMRKPERKRRLFARPG
ncbi:tetratricopeptide repeat protein [candidate division WOR-3 bacterium]|nr:tetratricopeptide repeat protein [candidate division WOR-3 bacterium]